MQQRLEGWLLAKGFLKICKLHFTTVNGIQLWEGGTRTREMNVLFEEFSYAVFLEVGGPSDGMYAIS